MIILITILSVVASGIIYLPIWLPILMACLTGNYYLLFYMFFALLSIPLDLVVSFLFVAFWKGL